jgi:hypothetical protein
MWEAPSVRRNVAIKGRLALWTNPVHALGEKSSFPYGITMQ